MKKKFLVVLDVDVVNTLDTKVIRPCSRSDIINAGMKYLLQSPYILEAFVKETNFSLQEIAKRDIQQ